MKNPSKQAGGGPGESVALAPVVDELCRMAETALAGRNGTGRFVLPSRDAVIECVECLRSVFFPGYF
ncbi:MAG TPA: serine acetyltransferase, partial [Anaeromyxobacteraceae bacterium]